MAMHTPRYNNWLTFGNLLTLAAGAITAVSMFVIMDTRSQANAEQIVELKAKIHDNEDDIENLKLNQVRIFEKLDNIYVGVNEIRATLKGLE